MICVICKIYKENSMKVCFECYIKLPKCFLCENNKDSFRYITPNVDT